MICVEKSRRPCDVLWITRNVLVVVGRCCGNDAASLCDLQNHMRFCFRFTFSRFFVNFTYWLSFDPIFLSFLFLGSTKGCPILEELWWCFWIHFMKICIFDIFSKPDRMPYFRINPVQNGTFQSWHHSSKSDSSPSTQVYRDNYTGDVVTVST